MLVLERRAGSSIQIGKDIRVHVRSIKGRKAVKLGIDAPRDICVVRDELTAFGRESNRVEEARAGFRVVVVEDEADHAQLIELALQDHGISEITVVKSGEAAVQMLVDQPREAVPRPHLVLLDLRLPGLSGFDVLRAFRTDPSMRLVPIVILSCHGDEIQVSRCLDAGANAYVSKAARHEEFQDSVARIADFWTHARLVA